MKLAFPLPALAALAAAACFVPLAQAQAPIYDSIGPTTGSVPYRALSWDQIGGFITFAGVDRQLTDVTVRMASQTIAANGAPYQLSMTISLYNAGADGTPGAFLTSMTGTFAVPATPQANSSALFDVTFTFPSMLMLPDSVIWTLGFDPGVNGAPQNALNIATIPGSPSVGAVGNRDVYYSTTGDNPNPQFATIQRGTVTDLNGNVVIASARFNAIPEPGVAVLAGAGLLALAMRARRRG